MTSLEKKLAEWFTPGLRTWIYSVAAATGPMCVFYGIASSAEWTLWVALAQTVLVPGLARQFVSPAPPVVQNFHTGGLVRPEAFIPSARRSGKSARIRQEIERKLLNPNDVQPIMWSPPAEEQWLDPLVKGLADTLDLYREKHGAIVPGTTITCDVGADEASILITPKVSREPIFGPRQGDPIDLSAPSEPTPIADQAYRALEEQDWRDSLPSAEYDATLPGSDVPDEQELDLPPVDDGSPVVTQSVFDVSPGAFIDAYGASEGPVESGMQQSFPGQGERAAEEVSTVVAGEGGGSEIETPGQDDGSAPVADQVPD